VARFHGRNGLVYLGLTNGGSASPVAFISDWTINRTIQKVDVTAMGDANKTYVSGIPDAAGEFNGWYDNATPQMYAAAVDGLSRNWYLYEDAVNSPTNYWYGTILPDMSVAGSESAAVSIKCSWNAAGPVQRMRAGVVG
jgi:hypothetical protein